MKKNISNNLILTSMLIILVGFTCFNPLKLDISMSKSHDDESYTPSVSNIARVFWENNGTLIYNGSGLSTFAPEMCFDGWGGSIVTWAEDRAGDGYDIYVKKVSSDGDTRWGVNGTVVCNATNDQLSPKIVSDGEHGAIIAWSDYRNNNDYNVYALRIFSDGSLYPGWTHNGTLICNESVDQNSINMIRPSSDGAIIAWRDFRDDPNGDIYAQWISKIGDPKWNLWNNKNYNGTAICTQGDSQGTPRLVSDGMNGAIITWDDNRTGPEDIYAQRINSTGALSWAGDGEVICDAGETQILPEITTDGNGGAIITWRDERHSIDADIYAQRINWSGDIEWKANGIVVSNETGTQFTHKICSDESGGAIITWLDQRGSSDDIYAQKINFNGVGQWEDNGTAICTQEDAQTIPKLASDGSGGAFITWIDSRNSLITGKDIYLQWINLNGSFMWNANDTAICTATGDQAYVSIFSVDWGERTTIVTWVDEMGTNNDIYGQKLRNDRPPTSNHPETVLSTSMGYETIDWRLYDDFGGGNYRVWANNTQGNYYVWENWSSWSYGSDLSVEINRTIPGDFNYTIEYYDDYGQYGIPDTVIVTITDAIPTANHSGSITTTAGGSETINWKLKDDFGGGNYRVWANNSINDYYLWRNWTAWISGGTLNVPINRTIPGIFNYTIEYNDMHGEIGVPDSVYVTITNAVPTAIADIPPGEDIPQNSTETIPWTLSDDFAGGQYRVLVNAIAGQWAAWTSGVTINHPIDTSTMGIFNYTIQYHDAYGLYGVPNTALITIVEPDPDPGNGNGNGTTTSPIPGPSPFLILIITLITVSYALKKTIRNKAKKTR